jgi:hypothetical protein
MYVKSLTIPRVHVLFLVRYGDTTIADYALSFLISGYKYAVTYLLMFLSTRQK